MAAQALRSPQPRLVEKGDVRHGLTPATDFIPIGAFSRLLSGAAYHRAPGFPLGVTTVTEHRGNYQCPKPTTLTRAARATGPAAAAAAAGAGDGGNIRSAAVTTEAVAEWTVADMAEAEPYPLPEVRTRTCARTPKAWRASSPVPPLGARQVDAGGAPAGRVLPTAGEETLAAGYAYPGLSPGSRYLSRTPTIRLSPSARCSSARTALITWPRPPRSGITRYSPLATSCTRATASPLAGRVTSSSLPRTRTARTARGVAGLLAGDTDDLVQQREPGGPTEDIGGAVLRPLNSRKISDVVGWLGFPGTGRARSTGSSSAIPPRRRSMAKGSTPSPPRTLTTAACPASLRLRLAATSPVAAAVGRGSRKFQRQLGQWCQQLPDHQPTAGDELAVLRRPRQVHQDLLVGGTP